MIQFFCGDGKGKTTAAIGGAIRMAGAGGKVLFCQFYKNGDSSEVEILKKIEGITYLDQEIEFELLSNVDDEQIKTAYGHMLTNIFNMHQNEHYDMIVLDEAGYILNKEFIELIDAERECCEVVITGHFFDDEIKDVADYITFCKKEKHPFEKGIAARKGIEY